MNKWTCGHTSAEEASLAAGVDCRQRRTGFKRLKRSPAQLIYQTCIQFSAMLRTLEVVVDLKVEGLVAAADCRHEDTLCTAVLDHSTQETFKCQTDTHGAAVRVVSALLA